MGRTQWPGHGALEILVQEPDLLQTELYKHVVAFWICRRLVMGVWRDLKTNELQYAVDSAGQ